MRIGFNAFWLKVIAIVAMLIDHVGAVLFPDIIGLRIIGRLSFPIFAFLLSEGFFYTKDIRKYMLRIGILAVISEVPFDIALRGRMIDFSSQNIFFTLLAGLLMLYLFVHLTQPVMKVLAVLAIMVGSDFLHFDYGSTGLLTICIFYCFRSKPIIQVAGMSAMNLFLFGGVQSCAAFASLPILLYNKKEGWKCKPLFYCIYPVHLLVLYVIRQWM